MLNDPPTIFPVTVRFVPSKYSLSVPRLNLPDASNQIPPVLYVLVPEEIAVVDAVPVPVNLRVFVPLPTFTVFKNVPDVALIAPSTKSPSPIVNVSF